MRHISQVRRHEYPGCSRHFSLLRRSRLHWLGVTRKPEWIVVAHAAIVFNCTSRWQSCYGKGQSEIATDLRVNQYKRMKTHIIAHSNRFLPATKICVTNRGKKIRDLSIIFDEFIYTEVLYYSMEPPFWHRYVIMFQWVGRVCDEQINTRIYWLYVAILTQSGWNVAEIVSLPIERSLADMHTCITLERYISLRCHECVTHCRPYNYTHHLCDTVCVAPVGESGVGSTWFW